MIPRAPFSNPYAMNTIRLGKIARLPRAIRDPLNRRLQDLSLIHISEPTRPY